MGKTKKEKPVKAKKELLNVEEALDSLIIKAKFSIVEIKMKNDWRWKIKMLVHETLPKSYHDYAIKLEFDDEPFLKSIAQTAFK